MILRHERILPLLPQAYLLHYTDPAKVRECGTYMHTQTNGSTHTHEFLGLHPHAEYHLPIVQLKLLETCTACLG